MNVNQGLFHQQPSRPVTGGRSIRIEELMMRVSWFVKLRYGVVLFLYLSLLLLPWLIDQFPVRIYLFLTSLLLLLNLLHHGLVRQLRADFQPTERHVRRLSGFQVVSDLLILSLVLYLSGGIYNPFLYVFSFHIVIATMLLPHRLTILLALGSITFFLVLVFLSHVGSIPFFDLSPLIPVRDQFLHSPWSLGGKIAGFLFTMYGLIYLVTTISNRLEEKEARLVEVSEELSRLDNIRMQTLYQVAHDLKAPAAAVQSLLNLVLKGYAGDVPAAVRPLLERASKRNRNLTIIVREMLDLANYQSSQQAPSGPCEAVDLVALAREACLLSEEGRVERGVKEVRWKLDFPDRLEIRGVREQLLNLFSNLMVNAIKYSGPIVEIGVTLRQRDRGVELVVADNGIGMKAEEREKIFEEFYRAPRAKAMIEDGSGLGLAIVKRIVARHAGDIRVESREQVGTTFTVTLTGAPPGGEKEPYGNVTATA